MRALLTFAMLFLRCVLAIFRSRREQAVVELALRQQLTAYARMGSKPGLTPLDRAFWVALSQAWSGWKEALLARDLAARPWTAADLRGGAGTHWSPGP